MMYRIQGVGELFSFFITPWDSECQIFGNTNIIFINIRHLVCLGRRHIRAPLEYCKMLAQKFWVSHPLFGFTMVMFNNPYNKRERFFNVIKRYTMFFQNAILYAPKPFL